MNPTELSMLAMPSASLEVVLALAALTAAVGWPGALQAVRSRAAIAAWVPVAGLATLAAASALFGLTHPETLAAAFGPL